MYKKIYVIKQGDTNLYKIGITFDVDKRIKELQTANPYILKIIFVFETKHSNLFEKTLHRAYSKYNINGEWFELSEDDINKFIEFCEQTENNLNFLKMRKNPYV